MRRPFSSVALPSTLEGLYQAIMKQKPIGVGRLRPEIPKDLRLIVKTALQKDREDRYQTAAALADDLRAFLDGGSSQRRRRPTWGRS